MERVDLTQPTMLSQEGDVDVHEMQEQMFSGADDEELEEGVSEVEGSHGTTLYYQKAQRKQKAWEDMREEMLTRTFQFTGQVASSCVVCGEKDTPYRCLDCTHQGTFCEQCVLTLHTNVNLLHHVEILKEDVFWPFKLPRQYSFRCRCSTLRHSRTITVANLKGVLSDCSVEFCSCLPEFVQLLQFGFWGGTPTRPRIAFEIELLEIIHSIQLECHASLKSICLALESRKATMITLQTSSSKLYPVIIDAFEEFRLYKYRLDTLRSVIPELDEGNVCPACPKSNGAVFYSLDALFIGRRKNAGKSCGIPNLGEVMFYDQKKVDKFVAEYNPPAKSPESCHNFLAGSAIRSKNRYKDLDETAIFGCGCRHEFPKNFMNLKHGERLSYAVWILTELEKVAADKPSLKINVLYDIACTLTKHLHNQDEKELLDAFQFAIPVFHCYGHNGKCQVLFSPRRKKDFGLTDGEMLERLWAYIRGFGKMTKEMRPNHRTDVLTDALLHYARKTSDKIEVIIVERMQKAQQTEKETEKEIENLRDCIRSQPVDLETVQEWQIEETHYFEGDLGNDEASWTFKYVIYLDLYNSLHNAWKACKDSKQLTIKYNQMKKIDDILYEIEEENSISSRWSHDDEVYRSTKYKIVRNKLKKQLVEIRKRVVERCFLLGLKSKYSDGQSLATRLAKQINRVTKSLKRDIEKYNNDDHGIVQQESLPLAIAFDEIKDPDSQFWSILDGPCTNSNESQITIPFNIKRKGIDLCHLLARAREEQLLLQNEMRNAFQHYYHQHELITDFILASNMNQILDEVQYGELLFSRRKLLHVESRLLKIKEAFSPYIEIDMPRMFIITDDYLDNNQVILEEEDEESIIVNPLSSDTEDSDFEDTSDEEFSDDTIFI